MLNHLNIKPILQTVVVCLILMAAVFLSTKPYYNWDIFPYMALTINGPEIPFDSVHQEVFRQASRLIPHQDYDALLNLHPELVNHPDAFKGILKYFEIKPLYIQFIRLLHFLGLDLVKATYFPSVISYFLMGFLLSLWTQRIVNITISSILTLVIMASPLLVDLARYSSPDMLCAVLLLAGLFMSLEISAAGGLLVSGLALWVRPDSVFILLLQLVVMYKSLKLKIIPFILASLASVVISFAVTGPELLKEFLFTSVDYSSSWSADEWLSHYGRSIIFGFPSVINSFVLLFLVLGALLIFLQIKFNPRKYSIGSLLVIGGLIIIGMRFLLHPWLEDRLLINCYLVIIIGFIKTLHQVLNQTSDQKT